MRTWLLLALAACPAPQDPATPKIDIAATALATLDRDAAAMLELLRSLHAEAGATVASNLTVDLAKLDELNATYDDDDVRITLPAPPTSPDEARTYWEAWSKSTSDGAWNISEAFRDDTEMARLARFAAFGTLAREVGQFLQATYAGHLEPGPRELLADKLAISILDRLASRPELAELLARYRTLLGKWYAAIPEANRTTIPADADLDAWCAKHPIPDGVAAKASLQLARQLRLLARPPKLKALITDALLAPHQARLAKIDYGTPAKLTVTTGREVPANFSAFRRDRGSLRELTITLLDDAGQFHQLACAAGVCDYTNEAGASNKLAVANLLGGEMAAFERVHDLAIVRDKLWLLLGAEDQAGALAVIEIARPDAIKPAATYQKLAGGRLAASPSGAVSVMLQRGKAWTVEPRASDGATRAPAWMFTLDEVDADGKNGAAGGTLDDCTANDAGTIYCTAGVRIRAIEPDQITTLAGGVRDWIDSTDPKKAAFTSPHRLRATRDGFQLVDRRLTEGKPAWKVREIALRK
jgi:hypothetical protein